MGYQLAIGDRSYSSWSLRGWLVAKRAGVAFETCSGRMYGPDFARLLSEFAPASLVPALRLPSGLVVPETLAIAETLAEIAPHLWPSDPEERAIARALSSEMHASFFALRNHCNMNLREAYAECAAPPEVLKDLARVETLWAQAFDKASVSGPWLFGDWSIADAMFAPVCARIAGHSLPVGARALDYVKTQMTDPLFLEWRAAGLAEEADQPAYARDWPRKDWPY